MTKLRNLDASSEEPDRPAAGDESDEELKRSIDIEDDDNEVVVSRSELSGSDDEQSGANTNSMLDRPESMFTEKNAKMIEDNRYDQKFVVERSGEHYE